MYTIGSVKSSDRQKSSSSVEELVRAAPDWWRTHAVRARILLEWGKQDVDHERLERAVDAFDAAIHLIRLKPPGSSHSNSAP